MNAKGWLGGIGLAALAAGGIILGVSGDKGGKDVLEPNEIEEVVTESQVASRAVRSSNGRLVRIVGTKSDQEVGVGDSDLGRIVEVANHGNGICHVLLDAMPVPKSEIFPDGMEYVGNVPNIPSLAQYFGKASWPVIIAGSCNEIGSCIWSALLKGEGCVQAGSLANYVGSTMQEFLALPVGTKSRFLRTRGTCVGDDGPHNCTVPVGDERAIAGEPVTVPSSWSGRIDLNFVKGIGGSPEPRYELKEAEVAEIP